MKILGAGALIAIGSPSPLFAQPLQSSWSAEVQEEIADRADELRAFYAARSYRPLWFEVNGAALPAAEVLVERLETAKYDGIEGKSLRRLRTKSIRRALREAKDGDAEDVARAEVELSELFTDYVRAMRSVPASEMIYESLALSPAVPTPSFALDEAGSAASLELYVRDFGWMHPLYAPLRKALNTRGYSEAERKVIWQNLARVRALPGMPAERYVLVDTAGARLWMYEDGEPVNSMRVVVGKAESPTPTMAGFLRHAIVNPFWNIPPDLVQQNIATNVLELGTSYLKDRGYEVLSDYSDKPALVDPESVNWQEVAAGARFVRVRQKPGKHNFMGKVKYEFPNPLGIYLHDTPDKHLLKEDIRQLSAGCVRLEDADKLGRWLLGERIPKVGKAVEQRVDLPKLVPVYITYLTAMPTQNGISFRDDIYGRKEPGHLAQLDR